MARARKSSRSLPVADHLLEPRESTVLDLIDSLLNKGVVANGEVTLGVAGIDLIYLRLSSILCAADCVLPPTDDPMTGRRPKRRSRR